MGWWRWLLVAGLAGLGVLGSVAALLRVAILLRISLLRITAALLWVATLLRITLLRVRRLVALRVALRVVVLRIRGRVAVRGRGLPSGVFEFTYARSQTFKQFRDAFRSKQENYDENNQQQFATVGDTDKKQGSKHGREGTWPGRGL